MKVWNKWNMLCVANWTEQQQRLIPAAGLLGSQMQIAADKF